MLRRPLVDNRDPSPPQLSTPVHDALADPDPRRSSRAPPSCCRCRARRTSSSPRSCMGLDPTAPEMTLLLVMLHTGTMFAVIAYFWRWSRHATYFSSAQGFRTHARPRDHHDGGVTGAVGLVLLQLDQARLLAGGRGQLRGRAPLWQQARLMAAALAAAGVLIVAAARTQGGRRRADVSSSSLDRRGAGAVPAVSRLLALGRHDLDRTHPRPRPPSGRRSSASRSRSC